MTPYLKNFCASEPARLGLRPSSTFRGRGRSDFARAGEGAGAFGVIFGLSAGVGAGVGCLFRSRWWWAVPAWCGGCCPVSRLAAPGCCSCVPSACWRLVSSWACMSSPRHPCPHGPQPPRRRPAAHGSGSHHATPGPICRRRLPLICRPSCPGSCPPPFCRRSCPAARRRVLCARSGILIAWIYTPPIIPQTQHFPQKITPEICAKKLPQSPLKGDGGTVLALLTARKNAAIIRGKRRPHGPPPSEPPRATTAQATRKGR